MAVLMLFLVVIAALVVIASGVWVAVALIGAICVRRSTASGQGQSQPQVTD